MQTTTISQYHNAYNKPADWVIFDLLSTTSDVCLQEKLLDSDCINQIQIAINSLSNLVKRANKDGGLQ
tara:strand:- start:201 stop:404 length:204 start_codon:yes stop_codon:yes gene_type:complete